MTTRIEPAAITGVFGYAVKRFSRKLLGEVPEPLGVYWHNRKVLRTMLSVQRKAATWDACDPNLKAFAHMAVAAKVGCSFCLDLGYFMAHSDGLDERKAREVPRWRESDVFTPLERDVLTYAEAMTETPTAVTDELAARLLGALGAEALVELTAHVGMSNLAGRTNTALGIEAQGFSSVCELPLATVSA